MFCVYESNIFVWCSSLHTYLRLPLSDCCRCCCCCCRRRRCSWLLVLLYCHSCLFDTAHFTFYSRFLCSWLKIMCSVSLLSLLYLFALLFVDFSRIHFSLLSISFSIIISFLFASFFLFIAYYTAMLLLHKSVTSQRFNSYISKRYSSLLVSFHTHLAQYSLWILMEMCISKH